MNFQEPLIQDLLNSAARPGELIWIGVRPGRREPVVSVEHAEVDEEHGLSGDRFQGRRGSLRQVTLIQAEHLDAIASYLGKDSIDPAVVRRNLVVRGVNLYAYRKGRIQIGDAILEGTGLCHPCSRMEEVLGTGGYNAMRGHGGLTARVVRAGTIRVGDKALVTPSVGSIDNED